MSKAASWIEGLRRAGFRGTLEPDASLAPLTTWRIGGPAQLLARPRDREDLLRLVGWAASRQVPWRVLGNGSNLLVADAGVAGIVVRLRRTLDRVVVDGRSLVSGAGASFPALARRAAREGLAGLEFGAGIPGTVGGALVMNAGWHQFEIGNFVSSVTSLQADGELRTRTRDACAFAYRDSVFRRADEIVLEAELKLEPGDPDEISARLEHFAESRKVNQPTHLPSCGSVFLKPANDFAGRLIDEAGLKGTRIGGVEVSPLHANFFVNVDHASAADVLALVEHVENEVLRRSGIRLTREFEYWN